MFTELADRNGKQEKSINKGNVCLHKRHINQIQLRKFEGDELTLELLCNIFLISTPLREMFSLTVGKYWVSSRKLNGLTLELLEKKSNYNLGPVVQAISSLVLICK